MIYREHPVTATGILGAEGAAAQAMRRPGCCPEVPKIPGQSFLVLHLHEVLAAFLSTTFSQMLAAQLLICLTQLLVSASQHLILLVLDSLQCPCCTRGKATPAFRNP